MVSSPNSPKSRPVTTSSSLLVRAGALYHPDPSGGGDGEAKTPTLEELQAQLAQAQEALKTLKTEKDELAADMDHALALVRLDTEPTKVEASLRRMMARAGYSHGEIEAYIKESLQAPAPEPRPAAKPKEKAVQTADDEGDDQGSMDPALEAILRTLASEVVSLRQKVSEVSGREVGRSAGEMRSRIDQEITKRLDSDEQLATILKKVSPDASKARDSVTKDVLLMTKELLREKQRENGGRLDPSWIGAAVEKATAEVGTRYRTVIGDPSTLGRTPETVAEATRFLKTEPVKAPEFKAGETSLADLREQSRQWATDALSRDLAKESTEESVV